MLIEARCVRTIGLAEERVSLRRRMVTPAKWDI